MGRSRHILKRMNQRAISHAMVEFTRDFGVDLPDGRTLLTKRALQEIQKVLRQKLSMVERMVQKGGLAVVEQDDHLITTYPLGPRRRR